MKKTMILAAFAALVSFASCQKEDVIDNKGTDKNASPVFTASIAGATKTTIDMTDGKVAWETTDEITVTDAASASAVYTIESIDATTGKATFAIKSGETALGAGPYTATYGTEPATAQTYSTTSGKLYMTAPATTTNSFEFTVQCGLMKLNLTKTGESVKSIAVTGTPTGGSETTYTLTCDPAESIVSAKDFFIALPDGNYNEIVITVSDGKFSVLSSASGITVEANHIKPVTFGESKIKFTTGYATRMGEINEKWIQLWKNGPKWAENNVCFREKHTFLDYYAWGASRARTPENRNTTNDGSGNLSGDDDTATYVWYGNWRMPTKEEFEALIENCDVEWVYNILDDVEGIELEGYIFKGKGAYASNSIFLPVAGNFNGGHYNHIHEEAYYWTSTPKDRDQAYYLTFYNDEESMRFRYEDRSCLYAVRAVLNEE